MLNSPKTMAVTLLKFWNNNLQNIGQWQELLDFNILLT